MLATHIVSLRARRPLLWLTSLAIPAMLFPATGGLSKLPSGEAIRRAGQEFVSADKTDGLSIAIVRGAKVDFFDFSSTLRGRIVEPSNRSVYEIGSITKVFTSLLLAHAVLERKIGLQDDVRRYLPGNYPNLAFKGSPVRIIDLADTTSALPDNLPDFQQVTSGTPDDQKPFVLAKVLREYRESEMLRDLHSVSLLGKPGEHPRHSNLAAELLGFILTRVYGQSFESLLRDKVQVPLGMQNGVAADDPKIVVTGYDAHRRVMPATDQASVLAAGGLRFSTQDMAKFLKAELADSDPAIRVTQTPALGATDAGGVGLSWQMTRNVEGALRLNVSGGTSGCSSYIEIYPELGYGIVMLANRSGETESLLYGLADALFAAIEGTPALNALKSALQETGYQGVENTVRQVKQQFPHLNLSEDFVNNWGGGLLGADSKAALALFQYNVRQWPASSDAFDSLGDAYVQTGDVASAVKAYRRALELDPANKEASDSLRSLLSRKDRN